MTAEMVRRFGVNWEKTAAGWHLPGGEQYKSPGRLALGGDWSHAAFWLVAGCLAGPVTVAGLDLQTHQPDRAMVELLRQMGGKPEQTPAGITVWPGRLHGITADVSGCPDLLPPLAVAMAFAEGESRLTGAARLRLKESDRLAGMAALLRTLGGRVEEEPDGLVIAGGGLRGGTAEPCGDHRLAMAAGVAALACSAPVTVKNVECVGKSYPDWWARLTEPDRAVK